MKNKYKKYIFGISIAVVVFPHIVALFYDFSESFWLTHNLIMIIAGATAYISK